ncbi:MAG: septum site-determining protein MinC [Anaerolineae bacterium]
MAVSLKGTKDGLLISLGAGEWSDILAELTAQLDRPRAAQFFHGAHARIVLDDRSLNGAELADLGRLLTQHDMQFDMAPLESHARQQLHERATAPEPELAPEPEPEPEPEPAPELAIDAPLAETPAGREPEPWVQAALVRRTVRSGQVIRYPGTVIVLGDVNPGGEIIAGGDVVIWGRLRGVVHAGASGNERAVVGALALAPTQLRIGGHIARAPDDRGKGNRGAEVARVRESRIVIESWKAKE